MPKKTVVPNFNEIDNKSLTYGIKTISKVFKDFSNSAEPLLGKLPDPSNKYIPKTKFLYYSNFISEVFHIKGSYMYDVQRKGKVRWCLLNSRCFEMGKGGGGMCYFGRPL